MTYCPSVSVHFALRDDRIGVLTLDRPEQRNSMTPELNDAFALAIAEARAAADLRCLIITGAGAYFSSGADLSRLQRGGDHLSASERSFAMYEPFLSVLDLAVPVIGALNGPAIGSGFALALLCDLRIGARDAHHGANFVTVGLSSGLAISYLLPRLIGLAPANEMLLAGRLITGAAAERLGLFNRAVDADDVLPAALALAADIAAAAPLAVRATKRAIQRGLDLHIRDAARLEAFAQAETLTSDHARDALAALRAGQPPRFGGS